MTLKEVKPGTTVKVDGDDYLILSMGDILAIVE